jgi:hypothetical protein
MRKDGSVRYTMGDSLPPGAVEITFAQLQDIPAPPEISDNPGTSESRKPLEIEKSLQLMLDRKVEEVKDGKISIGDAMAWADKNGGK